MQEHTNWKNNSTYNSSIMSLLIYQLLHTLDFSYSFNGFNQILHCFYWGETIRFLMWLEGLQLLFEEKNHVYSFVVFKYSQYIKQCNLPFFWSVPSICLEDFGSSLSLQVLQWFTALCSPKYWFNFTSSCSYHGL